MNKIHQYRPSFFEGFPNETAQFNSVESLLKVPFVEKFSKSPKFYRFSKYGNKLMAEYDEGSEWWIAGFIESPENLDIPEWNYESAEHKKVCQSDWFE